MALLMQRRVDRSTADGKISLLPKTVHGNPCNPSAVCIHKL